MNYARAELLNLLAGEYVLGHLRGHARKRFERLLLSNISVTQAVTDWQERLAPLSTLVPPVTPHRRVWRRISRDIKPARRRRTALFAAWATAVVTSAAFLSVFGLYLAQSVVTPTPRTKLAVISSKQGAPRWIVTVRGQQLKTHAIEQTVPPQGKSYQLWMLPGGGAKPVSLGLLPSSGVANETLSEAQLRALKRSGGLAVSMEPEGGSPTGLPTGPVVYQASFVGS